MSRGVALFALVASLAFASLEARAQVVGGTMPESAPASPSALRYRAPASCPSVKDWVATTRQRIQRRSPGAVLPSELRVEVRQGSTVSGSSEFVGTLKGGESPHSERAVRGAHCEDVLEALSLMAALQAQPPPVESAPLVPVGDAADSMRDVQSTKLAPVSEGRWALVGFVDTRSAFGAASALGYGVGARWAPQLAGHPWLLATFYGSSPRSVEVGEAGARAHFRRFGAHLAGCAGRLDALNGHLVFRPCTTLGAGYLWARGSQVDDARSVAAPWFELGAELSAEVRRGAWAARAVLGGTAPLTRPTFRFRPDATALRSDSLGYRAELGISWSL